MSDLATKIRYKRADALAVARELLPLQSLCEPGKFLFVGSLRRRKETVGDIEMLYVPRMIQTRDPGDLFGKQIAVNAVDQALAVCLSSGLLSKRERVTGGTMWGEHNKFARHTASGLPIDFFQATFQNWANLLVCRTGGAVSNLAICEGAQDKGWKWDPYSPGFTRPCASRGAGWLDVRPMHSEQEVFDFAAIPYLEPWDRP